MSGLKNIFHRPKGVVADPGFKPASGLRYQGFFDALHAAAAFDWYMEVGCRSGVNLAKAQGKTIGVDPFFQVKGDIIAAKPALHIFQQTSDDFFAGGFLARNDIRLSVSFLDGMHLFEFLLRDFMNTEAQSRADGVILMHDCTPYDHAMTTRDYASRRGLAWTGDVWKLLPILQEHRPDLRVQVLDSASTGLVAVTNLDPANRVLNDRFEDILQAYRDVTLEAFGVERFFSSFSYVDAAAEVELGFPTFRPVTLPPSEKPQMEWVSP